MIWKNMKKWFGTGSVKSQKKNLINNQSMTENMWTLN